MGSLNFDFKKWFSNDIYLRHLVWKHYPQKDKETLFYGTRCREYVLKISGLNNVIR